MKYFQISLSFLLIAVTAAFYFTDNEDFGIPVAGKRSAKYEKFLKLNRADTNADGFLTEKEFNNLLQSKFQSVVIKILFNMIDVNRK